MNKIKIKDEILFETAIDGERLGNSLDSFHRSNLKFARVYTYGVIDFEEVNVTDKYKVSGETL